MKTWITTLTYFYTLAVSVAVEVGPVIEVAGQVPGSRNQTWASVA